ncbi:MAG: hypothetical protein ACRC8Y_01290, partial [Chroococcales cyanobacterium]
MTEITQGLDETSVSVPPTDLNDQRQQLLDLLCQLAYREGDFTLSSGQSSRYYINGKQVTLHPVGALLTGQVLFSMLSPETLAVAG